MRQFKNYAPQRIQAFEPLPVGGYVAVIKGVAIENYNGSELMNAMVDIAEGDQTDYYLKDYKSQSSDNKKWRGNVKLWLPKDDGSEKDDYTKRTFNNFMACVEESNPGYHWNWDENTLKEKKIGILAREFEWLNKNTGKTSWLIELVNPHSVDDIRNGKFRMPERRPLKNQPVAAPAPGSFQPTDDTDDDLPF